MFYIRYKTATHKDIHGPFRTINAARKRMRRELNWYIGRLAAIVEADNFSEALRADAIECASELNAA